MHLSPAEAAFLLHLICESDAYNDEDETAVLLANKLFHILHKEAA